MKKLLAILLAMMLVLFSVAAFAAGGNNTGTGKPANGEESGEDATRADPDPYNGKLDVTLQLPKSFTAKHGTAPAETFTFTFAPVSYTSPADLVIEAAGTTPVTTSTAAADIPAVSPVTVSFAAGDTTTSKTVDVVIPKDDYKYGRYVYEVTETIPNPKTAGVTYAESKKMYMVVTVVSDSSNRPNEAAGTKHFVVVLHEDSVAGNKTDRLFENTYDAGSLTVEKKIDGNMADLGDRFDFTITFTQASGTQITAAQKAAIGITTTGGTNGAWSDTALVYTVTLGNANTITFSNIPEGTTYTVVETNKNGLSSGEMDGYTQVTTPTDTGLTISGGDNDKVTVTNTRDVPVDTGVTLETSAYVLIMALALAGFVMMAIRRREEY